MNLFFVLQAREAELARGEFLVLASTTNEILIIELELKQSARYAADFTSKGTVTEGRKLAGRPAVVVCNGDWFYVTLEGNIELFGR